MLGLVRGFSRRPRWCLHLERACALASFPFGAVTLGCARHRPVHRGRDIAQWRAAATTAHSNDTAGSATLPSKSSRRLRRLLQVSFVLLSTGAVLGACTGYIVLTNGGYEMWRYFGAGEADGKESTSENNENQTSKASRQQRRWREAMRLVHGIKRRINELEFEAGFETNLFW